MVISAFLPDGTRFHLPLEILPRRGDHLVLVGHGMGRVDRVVWRVNPSTDHVDVRVWLDEWMPE